MKPDVLNMKCAMALVIGAMLAAGPVMADRPAGKGKDKQKSEQRDDGK